MSTTQRLTNRLYILQQLRSFLALSGNGLVRHGEVALIGLTELALKLRSYGLNTLKLQSILRTRSLLKLRTTHAGWMRTFRATSLTLRMTHLLRMNTDLVSSGQQTQKQAYPNLLRMVRNLFTVLAMSDEPERIFLCAGEITTTHRGRLSARTIRKAQCIKGWIKTGIITKF
jgi:hypothetical protein